MIPVVTKIQTKERNYQPKKFCDNSKEENIKHNNEILYNALETIKLILKDNVNKNLYAFRVISNNKKIDSGSITINVKIFSKINMKIFRNLIFVANRDDKTGNVHFIILSNDHEVSSVLFASTDQYPEIKLRKYLPKIIMSTQNMIK